MIVHTLNCDPASFGAIDAGDKLFEVRLEDRNYRVGDWLDLRCASLADVREMRRYSEIQAREVEGHGMGLTPEQFVRLDQLRNCPRLRCEITSKVRLSGAIAPPEPHWWKPNEAMQHGIAVLGIRVERQGRA